jgi:putative peptidoglycan lipid II flippase
MAVFAMAPLFVARHYTTPSWSPVLLNVSLILSCFGFERWFGSPVWSLVIGVWLGGFAQLFMMWWAMHKYVGVVWPNFHLRHPGIPKVCWLLLPVVLGQATGEVNKLVDRFFAYSLPTGTVSALFYANRLVQLPLAVFGIAASVAILPSIARSATRGDDEAIRDTLLHGFRQTFYLIFPAMIGTMILGLPIVRLLFEHGRFEAQTTDMTAVALFYSALGLLSFSGVKVSVQGFYAEQRTKPPVIVASISMLLNILLILALVRPLGFRGLVIATTVSYTVNFALLYVLLCKRYGALWDGPMFGSMFRTMAATAVMAVATWGVYAVSVRVVGDAGLVQQCVNVGAALTAAAGGYAVASWFLRIPEFDQFAQVLRRR